MLFIPNPVLVLILQCCCRQMRHGCEPGRECQSQVRICGRRRVPQRLICLCQHAKDPETRPQISCPGLKDSGFNQWTCSLPSNGVGEFCFLTPQSNLRTESLVLARWNRKKTDLRTLKGHNLWAICAVERGFNGHWNTRSCIATDVFISLVRCNRKVPHLKHESVMLTRHCHAFTSGNEWSTNGRLDQFVRINYPQNQATFWPSANPSITRSSWSSPWSEQESIASWTVSPKH